MLGITVVTLNDSAFVLNRFLILVNKTKNYTLSISYGE